MCGQMSLFQPQPEIERRFGATSIKPLGQRYNIAPRDDLAVIPNTDPEQIEQYEWGLLPHWADGPDAGPRPINARAESIAEKPYFRGAFKERRCLVLADGFYEWKGFRGSKQPYRIERADDDLFAFAGLWERWESNSGSLSSVTIVTTEPNAEMESIHDRMPVILDESEERSWLQEDDPDELQAMLDPYPDGHLDTYEITTKINDPANDYPTVIQPIGHGQSGLGDF